MVASAADPVQPYPFWDGQESVAEYAKRTGLESTKTLDLGNGVKLELVLIPAGKFVMGTPELPPVEQEHFTKQIWIGRMTLATSVGVVLVMLAFVIVRAVREKHRPQVSLAGLLVLAITSGAGLLGGLSWYHTARALSDAQNEYQAAMARFKSSYGNQWPAHDVTISTPYYIGKFEVTQEQYQQVTGTNQSYFEGRDLPVETVSWDDAQEFCTRVSKTTGLTVRLSSEAEWEYACRAGTKTTYYTGDTEKELDRAAWYFPNSRSRTNPVGLKRPNAWGVYDMHGNVWEWCQDWYGEYPKGVVTDPQGRATGDGRVLRSGSWLGEPENCRSAIRYGDTPDVRGFNRGFRVVLALTP
jgi:formylglycine-generating enzyme required for sulfatase activity